MNSNKNVIGLLTLGQSPRRDVMPTFQELLPAGVTVLQGGALDGLSKAQIRALSTSCADGIETRLAGGQAVTIAKKLLLPRLIEQAQQLQARCSQLLLLCSGEFPALRAECPAVVEPIFLLRGVIRALAAQKCLGIVGPQSDLAAAPGQWQPYAGSVVCAPASPYGEADAITAAVRRLEAQGAELMLLDDMGFSIAQQRLARQATSRAVLCATTVTARILAELLAADND